jgi:hypothetical protein
VAVTVERVLEAELDARDAAAHSFASSELR